KMLTPYLDSSRVALGFFLANQKTEPFFAHNGSNEGFNCDYYGSVYIGKGAVVMVNSDSYEIISVILNGIATVYDWKGFYKQEMKKLVKLSDTLITHYVGEYSFDETASVLVRKVGNHLEIQRKGDQDWERMYPVREHEFFLFSNQLSYLFLSDTNN